jgi:alanine-synthesizing transaminase
MFASRTNWRLEPNRFSLALENHRRTGAKLFDLTASNPTTCGFTYPEQEMLAALADPRALTYRPESKGLREAREAVANYYRGRVGFAAPASQRVDTHLVHGGRGEGASPAHAESGKASSADAADAGANLLHAVSVAVTTIDPENIVLTSGTSEGYSYIFRLLCEPGDEILVPAPSYPLFEFLADLADVRLVLYPLLYDHGWQIDFDALRAALTSRTRAVLVVHPNNPTGSFVKPREAAELAEICARRDIAIVADEVFLDYAAIKRTAGDRTGHERSGADRAGGDRAKSHGADSDGTDGAAPRSFAFGSAALTFTLSGISKICALPQMKLAWIVAGGPQHLVAGAMERLEIIADTFLSPGAPAQVALPRFLEMRGGLQAQLQRRIAANLAYLDALLQSERGPLERLAREGGWYAVLRVPCSRSDEEYAVELLERCAVLVHPGQFFNFSQEGFLVLSLIAPEDEFQEGARRLHQFFAA